MSDPRTPKEVEICKLFDEMQSLRATKEGLAAREKREPLLIEGKQVDAEKLADAMLAMNIGKFKELVDVAVPIYADIILEIERLPGVAVAMDYFDQLKAEASAAS